MRRVWGWVLVLWFAAGSAAWAQGLVGLPLVTQKDGWARYTTESSDGPTELVFKVGVPGSHQGKKGQWFILEVDGPGVGRIAVHFLVAGGTFSPENMLVVRTYVPGQQPQERDVPADPGSSPPLEVRGKRKETVAGRTLVVTEYSIGGEITAGWSPSVPGLGLTYLTGPRPMRLVAFGVGGDPWKGAGPGLPLWPEPGKDTK
jgi:hypothetical protein